MKKVFVFYDGSNFYNKVKKLQPRIHLTTFDYLGLAQEFSGYKRVKTIYYVGEVRKFPYTLVLKIPLAKLPEGAPRMVGQKKLTERKNILFLRLPSLFAILGATWG